MAEFTVGKVFDFGEVFYGDECRREFKFDNPLRKLVKYEATIDKEYADVFSIADGSSVLL